LQTDIKRFQGTPDHVRFYFVHSETDAYIEVRDRAFRDRRIIYTVKGGCSIGLGLFPIGTRIETTDGFQSFAVKKT